MSAPVIKRPIVWALVFLCAGITTGVCFNENQAVTWALCVAAALASAAICFSSRWLPAAAFFIFFVIGALRASQSLGTDPDVLQWAKDGEKARFAGYVVESSASRSGRARVVLDTYLVENVGSRARRETRMRVIATLPEGAGAGIGDGMILRGKLSELDRARNPGAFDEFLYYRARKIHFKAFPEVESISKNTAPSLKLALAVCRDRISGIYESILPEGEASIIRSVVLGDKSGLDGTVSDLYRAAGVYHLLCVSGLHVSIISMVVCRLLELLLDRRRAGLLNLGCLLLYCLFTGAGVSTVRAVFMAGVVIIGRALFRRADLQSSVGFAAACMLVYEPMYLFDVGFQLSFSAVLAIAVLTEPIERALGRFAFAPRGARAAASANLAALLGTLPCLLYHFYILTPYAFFANLIILPTSSVLVIIGILAGAVGMFSLKAAEFLAGSLYLLLRFYRSVCELFQGLPAARVLLGSCGLFAAFAIAASALAFAFWFSAVPGRMKARRRVFLASLAVCAGAMLLHYQKPAFEITMLDVGQGDSFVIRHKKYVFVVDGGGLRVLGDNTGIRVLIPYLDYLGVDRVDGVFLSHPDNDHAAGIIELLPRKAIGRVYFSSAIDRGDPIYKALAESCETLQIPVSYLSKGDALEAGETRIGILYPPVGVTGGPNDTCIVQQFFYGGMSALFTGDIDVNIEDSLDFAPPDVLKVAHHGSKYSSGEGFLLKASPSVAIVSTGKGNVYGMPTPEVTGRLREMGIPLYNTAETGAVIIAFQKDGFSVNAMLKPPAF